MKTSTMLIIAAILVTLGSLTAFNFKIKDQYTSGSYKSRFRGMDFTPLSGIEELNLQAANRIALSIEQGEKEGIWINTSIKDNVKFNADRQILNFDLSDLGKKDRFYASRRDIIIITKKLSAVTAAPYFKDQAEASSPVYYSSETAISGYHSDELNLITGRAIGIYIHHTALKKLIANIGNQTDGGAELVLSPDTKIDTAQINLPGKSKLNLLDPKIIKTVYNLSDSAIVTLNGHSLQLIK